MMMVLKYAMTAKVSQIVPHIDMGFQALLASINIEKGDTI
jgi:hypothetical protein